MIKYIVYEWVRFFKGQVYEWVGLEILVRTPVPQLPLSYHPLPPPPPVPHPHPEEKSSKHYHQTLLLMSSDLTKAKQKNLCIHKLIS